MRTNRSLLPGLPSGRLGAAAVLLALALGGGTAPFAAAGDTLARTTADLRRAAASARPGTRIRLAPGVYEGGIHLVGVRGAAGNPVVLEAADPRDPPVFRGGGSGLQFTDPEHLEVRDLVLEGQTGNGLNLDDGGSPETPARHVLLRGIVVRDTGPDGNCDGIKLSGVLDFRVEGCTVERWGRGGSAVDMVGCQRGTIEGCSFRHVAGTATGSGVQAKGASSAISVRRCRFEHAGSRSVNCGGSTGLAYFRPPLATWKGPRYEAKDVTVEGCVFVGSDAAVAFVGVDGAVFRFNTIYRPGRWAFRILQETREEGFVPTRNGRVEDNLVVFRSDAWREGGTNLGPGTEPASFRFARNAWFCEDAPARTKSLVRLPAPEVEGLYGEDPRLADPAAGDLKPRARGRVARTGAEALPR